MRNLIIGLISIFFLNSSCATVNIGSKIAPEYQGVDTRAQNLVDEYIWLSKQNHITFNHKVTIGFKKINKDDVVGLCTYGGYFREIDIDIDYWNKSNHATKLALLFHELTHCYCGRGHDYKANKKYPETLTGRINEAFDWNLNGGERPGHFDDGCPTSLMYPEVVDNECLNVHYAQYIEEMFDRCKPW